VLEAEPIEGDAGIVGTEDSRGTLWSNPAVVALGAHRLAGLGDGSLLVGPALIPDVRSECARVLANAGEVARAGGLSEDYVVLRVRNVVRALDAAEVRGMGVLVE